jgi:hypothetical protein
VWCKTYSSCAQICARRVANFHQSFAPFSQNIDTEELVIASEIMSRTPSFLVNWYTNIVRRRDRSGLLPIKKVHKHELKNCKYVCRLYHAIAIAGAHTWEQKGADRSQDLYCYRIPLPNLNIEQPYMSPIAKTREMFITKCEFQWQDYIHVRKTALSR